MGFRVGGIGIGCCAALRCQFHIRSYAAPRFICRRFNHPIPLINTENPYEAHLFYVPALNFFYRWGLMATRTAERFPLVMTTWIWASFSLLS